MSVVKNVFSVCGLRIIGSNVSSVLIIAYSDISISLSDVGLVTSHTGQFVYTAFIILCEGVQLWDGSYVAIFSKLASVFVDLKAILSFESLNMLVTILIFGL